MSVTTETNKVPYDCDGSTVEFDFSFKIFSTDEIKVYLYDTINDVETLLAETTHYSVSTENADYSDGGTVTTVETYSSDYQLTILREVDLTQESEYEEGEDLPAKQIENDFDKLCMIVQQLGEKIGRQPFAPVSDPSSLDMELPTKAERASKLAAYDAEGEPIAATGVSSVPVTSFMTTVLDDETAAAARGTLDVLSTSEINIIIPIGVMWDYSGNSDPNSKWMICNYRSISQSTYATLFALIGHRFAKTKSDRDTAEAASEFYIPDCIDYYIRAGKNNTFAYTAINTSTDRITITNHGYTRDGTPVRFWTDDTLPSVISGLTNQSWETIYIRIIDSDTIELYDTEEHAIDTSGTTGILDFTDQGAGTHELTQQGILIDDAYQRHWHEWYYYDIIYGTVGSNTTRLHWNGSNNNRAAETAQNHIRNPITDGINGTPRTTNETRPKTTYTNKIIRVL